MRMPMRNTISESANPIIKFDYDYVLLCPPKALRLWDKVRSHGLEIVFTVDYAQYC